MESDYKKLGKYITEVSNKNKNTQIKKLLGVSVNKIFIPSIANIIGTDLSTYKIVKKGQFAYGPVTSRNSDKISIALLEDEECIISTSYTVFEIIDTDELLPEYLMMWFRREEFDRYARYMSHGSVREIFGWEEMCDVELPIPDIEIQKEIVKEYNTIINRIEINNQLIQKCEETAQAIYKQWFVDFEFPDENGKPYKSNGGELVYNEELDLEIPKGWDVGTIGDYSKVKSGFAFKSDWWRQEGVPVIKIGSINDNSIKQNDVAFVDFDKAQKAKNYIVQKGDIVIAMTGATIGKIGLVTNIGNKILVNQRVGMFNLGQNPIEKSPFLYFTLQQKYVIDEIHNVGGDSAQANIGNGEIEEMFLFKENTIINKFNSLSKYIVNVILEKIEENNLNDDLKKILLSKMSKLIPIEVSQ